MSPGGVTAIIVVFVILAIGLGIASYYANQRRQKEFAAWAAQHGFTYAPRDDTYCEMPWGAPFGRGTGRQAQDVVTGVVDEHPALCFTLRFQTTTSNGKTTQTQTHYYAIHSLHLPRALPELRVGPEGFFSSIASMVSVHDIEFESEDFNRAYKVRSGDRKFASDVINPQMMQFLLDSSAPGFSIIGADIVLIDSGRLESASIAGNLAYLSAVVQRVPEFVWKA
jgi:hypothetical protein